MNTLISIGQIIDKSWDQYLAHFKGLMYVTLWALVLVPFSLVRTYLAPQGELPELALIIEGIGTNWGWIAVIYGAVVAFILVPALTIWIYINLVKTVSLQHNKQQLVWRDLYAFGFKTFFSYLWVAILKTLVLLLPLLLLIPGITLIVVNLYVDGGNMLGLGSILLMFVGLVAAFALLLLLVIELNFVGFTRILDGIHGTGTLKESCALVKGRFWKTLWRITIPKIVFSLATAFLHIIAIIFIIAATYGLYAINDTVGFIGIIILMPVLMTGISALTSPIFVIADYFLYESLKQTRT